MSSRSNRGLVYFQLPFEMEAKSGRHKTFDGYPVYLLGEITRRRQQNFYALRKKCLDENVLFEDTEFPANDKSLFYMDSDESFEWLRPTEICQNPQFFVDGFSRFDVRQGRLGDCWLLAAAANLTQNRKLFTRVVCNDNSFKHMYAGIFHFRFWQYGKWVDVVIDDRLPTLDGKLVYMHSTDGDEFWSALLEKAYAKLHGSYEALMGGTTCEALSDFTGGITEIFELDEPPSYLFEILEKGFERSSMMGCLIYPHSEDPDYETPEGLICGHAYSITKVKAFDLNGKVVKILRLRNPWGNEKEWNGAWCDKSQEWSMIDEKLKKELGLIFDNDGEFWMSFEDFVSYFDHLEICNLSPDCLISDHVDVNWNLKEFKGEWVTGISAGGCRNYLETFQQNPQYVMKLEKPGEVVIALMQKNRRSKCVGANFLRVGFILYRLSDEDLLNKPQKTEFFMYNKSVGSSSYTNLREVSRRFKLDAGNYLIIPSTIEPNSNGDFWIRIFSENCSAFEEHDEDIEVDNWSANVENSKIATELFIKFSSLDDQVGWRKLRQILEYSMYDTETNRHFSKEICRSMVALDDYDRSGKLELEEFKFLFNEIMRWKNIFETFDHDNAKKINVCDLREAFKNCGYQLNNHILCSILHRFGSEDNTIEFEDFIMCAVKLRTLIKNFQAKAGDKDEQKFTIFEWITNALYS